MDQLKKPPTACKAPLCGGYAEERGWCATHAKENPQQFRLAGKKWESEWKFMYEDPRWKHPTKGLKIFIRQRDPVCRICNRKPTAIIDHVIPHRGDWTLFLDATNCQGTCKPCHDSKTLSEIAARKGGGGTPSPLTGNIITGGV
jgi:5-methylcytosine-specific restriction protein A